MNLELTPAEAEALRRSLYGWTLSADDYAALDAISERLGAPTRQPWDRLMVPAETWAKIVQTAHATAHEPAE